MAYTVYEPLPQAESLVMCFDVGSPNTIINYNDATPATFYDCSGNGNHANVQNTELTLTTADGAWCLDNSEDSGYEVTANADLETADFTWLFWWHRDDQVAQWERIVSQAGIDFIIAVGNSPQGNIKWYHSSWRDPGYTMPITTWTMITLSHDNGATNGSKFYANTNLEDQITDTRARSGDIYINGPISSNAERPNGRMGYFAMWKTNLSQADVQQVYKITRGKFGV